MKASQQRMRTQKFDLMQAWNVNDANYDIGLLRDWKAEEVCRYTGITSSSGRDHAALEQVVKREMPDFLQINYSLGDRDAEVPTAAGRQRRRMRGSYECTLRRKHYVQQSGRQAAAGLG